MSIDVGTDVSSEAVTSNSETECGMDPTASDRAASPGVKIIFILATMISGCNCSKALYRNMSEMHFNELTLTEKIMSHCAALPASIPSSIKRSVRNFRHD